MSDGPTIVIVVEGGVVQNVLTNRLESPNVVIVDYDNARAGDKDGGVYDPILEYNPEEVRLICTLEHPDVKKYVEQNRDIPDGPGAHPTSV